MILHIDMDAFYASVEERERPELKGRPLIVGGTPEGRGVVAAANYEARKFGIHSAMATGRALKLCPTATVLRPRMEFYAGVSRKIREIFHRYTPLVEPLSLDEAFLDASGSTLLFGSVEDIGRRIKDEIQAELDLIASVGVAPNKFLAKLASDLEKPDGFTVIKADEIQQRLDPLPVSRIWGVGKATLEKFHRLNVHSIGQLRALSKEQLQAEFGRSGDHFWKLARGIDHRSVVADREAKSISHEHTFAADIDDADALKAWLLELTEQVARRLRRHDLLGRTVHLKVRYSNFDTITRSRTLPAASNTTRTLWQAVSDMIENHLPDRPLVVRLLGMGVSNFDAPPVNRQQTLFDAESSEADGDERDSRLDNVADQIRSRFGHKSLRRGSVMKHRARHDRQPRPDDDAS